MKKIEVIDQFKDILFNKNLSDLYIFDEELETFYDDYHEIEWQIRDFSNGDFKSILIRFCEDTSHTYIELYENDFNNTYDLIYYALDEAVGDLELKYNRKMRERYGKSVCAE